MYLRHLKAQSVVQLRVLLLCRLALAFHRLAHSDTNITCMGNDVVFFYNHIFCLFDCVVQYNYFALHQLETDVANATRVI